VNDAMMPYKIPAIDASKTRVKTARILRIFFFRITTFDTPLGTFFEKFEVVFAEFLLLVETLDSLEFRLPQLGK
jgi:uncharacterized membrane protein